MAYFEGEIPVVTNGYGNNANNGWNDWSWIIGLALVGGLFGGWGNGGFGFGGGRGGYGYTGIPENFALQTDFATIERKLDSISNGICDSTFALNNTITTGNFNTINTITQAASGLNTALVQGFNGVDNAICTLGYQNQAGFNALGTQIASTGCDIRQAISDCCCTTQRSIDRLSYENAKNTCDIIRSGQDNTRAILDYLTTEKISSLQAENSGLKAQISNDRQTRTIVNELRDGCPIPAYLTCNPNVPFGYGYGVPFTNCGCTNIQ